MRAAGVHEDVLVVVSQVWQTAAVAIRAGAEAFLVDSPVLPAEVDALPGLLEQARFDVVGLLATHADWDHLLGRGAFPGASLGVAETTAARLRAEPGAAQRELREFDERFYLRRPPLSLGDVQALPVPGHVEIGERSLELHPAEGHTADGMAVVVPWAKVVVAGDYLSPVEAPVISSGGSISAYEATLERLRPLVEAADVVVAGHGGEIGRSHALRVLDEDLAYLAAVREHGEDAPPPRGVLSGGRRASAG